MPSARKGRTKPDSLALLGIAHRAGAVERGLDMARRAVRDGRARLVLIADDASTTQLKKLLGLLVHRPIPVRQIAGRAALGAALGTPPLSAVAVTDGELAASILRGLPAEGATGGEIEEGGGSDGVRDEKDGRGSKASGG